VVCPIEPRETASPSRTAIPPPPPYRASAAVRRYSPAASTIRYAQTPPTRKPSRSLPQKT